MKMVVKSQVLESWWSGPRVTAGVVQLSVGVLMTATDVIDLDTGQGTVQMTETTASDVPVSLVDAIGHHHQEEGGGQGQEVTREIEIGGRGGAQGHALGAGVVVGTAGGGQGHVATTERGVVVVGVTPGADQNLNHEVGQRAKVNLLPQSHGVALVVQVRHKPMATTTVIGPHPDHQLAQIQAHQNETFNISQLVLSSSAVFCFPSKICIV